jgi:hypothetical protein
MFEVDQDVAGLLARLEQEMLLLSEADQNFVSGCRAAIDNGVVLTAQNKAQLRKITSTLVQTGHNVLGSTLSITQVVKDLGGALHTMTTHEKAIAAAAARKLQHQIPMTQGEIEQLLQVYSSKGF